MIGSRRRGGGMEVGSEREASEQVESGGRALIAISISERQRGSGGLLLGKVGITLLQ